jgi:Protein of unknown function (DUF3300)
MKPKNRKLIQGLIFIIGVALSSTAFAQQAQSQEMTTTTSDQEAPKLPAGELDSLVAPIALYSDDLLAQTLAASTYPLEIIQLQQWMDKNKSLTGQALADAVAKQPWDPSVQGLVMFPDVVQRMAGNVQWTTDLGNAFLAQQSDVMGAVQRMRAKAQGTGNLKTSSQQVVETKTVGGGTAGPSRQVIEIQQANPDVVYVPSYDPTVVYGAAPAEYPYYPYTYPGYYPGTALMWGAGVALGAAAWGAWGGHWGDCDWNNGDVNINNNNNFNRNYNKNVNRGQRGQAGQGNRWQHNPQHRGNAPYGNRQTANKFGGNARQQPGRGAGGRGGAGGPGGIGGAGGAGRPGGAGGIGGAGGVGGAGRPGGPGGVGGAGRPGGAGGPGGPGGVGGAGRPGSAGGAGARPGGGQAGARPGGGAGARPGGGGAGARPGGSTSKKQVGNRSAASRPSSGAKKGGGFGGGGSGNYARASSNRGGHSMGGGGYSRGGGAGMSRGGGGGRGGAGMSRGGGGRGGGGRGGGGGRRR